MKKILLSLLLAAAGLLVAAPARAQLFKFGVVTGMNLSKLSIKGDKGAVSNALNQVLDSENRAGWYVGPKIWINTPLGIGVDGALQYSQRRLDTPAGSDTYRSLEIPVNLRYNIGLGSIASVYVSTGPQFGFNVGGMDGEDWLNTAVGGLTGNGSAVFKKSNMNTTWNVGAGIKLLGHLELGVGYNFGIGNVGKTVIDLSGYGSALGEAEVEYKTNTFQVQAAYIF